MVIVLGNKKRDSLGDRMKGYENISRYGLVRRVPVIIRLDGKAFHTFTRGMKKPFDTILMSTMQETMRYMCANVQNCVFGYTQSDEITLVLVDDTDIHTDAWFGNGVQKMCSVAASMATLAFNRFFKEKVTEYSDKMYDMFDETPVDEEYILRLFQKIDIALFDARVFNLPKYEVCNCLIWRQQDATRNSIESVGQAYFSSKDLMGKPCNVVQDMLFTQHGVNWNDFPVMCKRGSCCYRVENVSEEASEGKVRRPWFVDLEPPIFTQDREYIEKHLGEF